MRRRELLVAAGSISLAGCVSDLTGSTTEEESDPGDRSGDGEQPTIEGPALAEQGRPTTICEESIKPDGIRALVEPAFGSPSEFPDDPDGYQPLADEKDDRVFSDREEGIGNNGNLVMYDSVTGSYWSQILAQAICGPMAEERLSVRPASTAAWKEWRADHPDTEVLLPPPASTIVDPPV